jgi:hypothetical protein
VVECSPATRAARVRFPVDAYIFKHRSIPIMPQPIFPSFWHNFPKSQ